MSVSTRSHTWRHSLNMRIRQSGYEYRPWSVDFLGVNPGFISAAVCPWGNNLASLCLRHRSCWMSSFPPPTPPCRVLSVSHETPHSLVSQEPWKWALQLLPVQRGGPRAARPQPPWSQHGQLCHVTPKGGTQLTEGDAYIRAWSLSYDPLQPEFKYDLPIRLLVQVCHEQETAEVLTCTQVQGLSRAAPGPLPEGARAVFSPARRVSLPLNLFAASLWTSVNPRGGHWVPFCAL